MKKIVLMILVLALMLGFKAGRVFALSTFQNAGFEDGDLGFWNVSGVCTISNGDIYSTPYEGSYMALLSSSAEHGGGYVFDNYMSQDIDAEAGTISFWYNFFTRDYDYDIPGFSVKINASEVFWLDAADAGIEYADPIWMTDWQQVSLDISGYTGAVTLSIYAGNSDDMGTDNDNNYNSWAYIDSAEPIFTPIPEPTTIVLFGIGILAILFLRRKMI